MTDFLVAALAMIVLLIPMALVAWRGTVMDAVVAYEAASSVVVTIFILLPQGFNRPSEFEFPVLYAGLLLGGALVFLHAMERWL